MNLQLVCRYILSLSKNENSFYEKNKTKQNKKRQKMRATARVEPWTTDVKSRHIRDFKIQDATAIRRHRK